MRRVVPAGRLQLAFSAVLTADDGFILGCLLLVFDDARGFSTSRTAASSLAAQLQFALRRAETRQGDAC